MAAIVKKGLSQASYNQSVKTPGMNQSEFGRMNRNNPF